MRYCGWIRLVRTSKVLRRRSLQVCGCNSSCPRRISVRRSSVAFRGLLIVSVACLFVLEAGILVQAKGKEKKSGKNGDSGTVSGLKNGHHVGTQRVSVPQGA